MTARVLALACLMALAGCETGHSPPASPTSHARMADRLVARGTAFARSGDLTRAAQYFDAALAEGAPAARVMPLLMAAYVQSRRYRMAIDRGEIYLVDHPGDGRMRFLVATLHAAIGNPTQARAHLERLVREQPGHASAHYALALLLRETGGDWELTQAHLREYLRLRPRGEHADAARAALGDGAP